MAPTTDPIRRALRVAMVLLVTAGPGVPALAAAFDVPAGRVAQITAVFSFVVVVLTALRNHLEDNTAMPAILKAPPSPGENPVPEPAPKPARKPRKAQGGYMSTQTVLVIVVIVVLLLVLLGR